MVGKAAVTAWISAPVAGRTPISSMISPASVVVILSSELRRPAQMHARMKVSVGLLSRTSSRRSEEHTSELQSLMRISYAVFCLKKKKKKSKQNNKTIDINQNNQHNNQTHKTHKMR